ncbi:MAG: exosortase/archaeosortase family protein [Candidatus Bathyarchaeales archaeon]
MEKTKGALGKATESIRAYYQYVVSAGLLLLLVFIVYGRDLEILFNEALQNEAFNHVLLIPIFAGFLFYLKKDIAKASLALQKKREPTKINYLDEMIGVCLCLIAFLIYWYGSYTFYPLEYHLFSLPVFVLGVTLILFSMKVMFALIFPTLFLLFLIPLPTEFIYAAGGVLGNINTQLSYTLLRTFGVPVTLSTSYGSPMLELQNSSGNPSQFSIGLPCSGIYSLIAFTMFAAFLALVMSGSVFRKASIVLFGFLLFDILNVVRITTIVSVAYGFGEEIAMFFFHSISGFILIFSGMLLTFFVAERFLKVRIILAEQEQSPCPKCRQSARKLENFCLNCGKFLSRSTKRISKRFIIKLSLLLIASSIIVLSINAPTFTTAKGPIGLASGVNWENATNVFPQIQGYQLAFSYRDVDYERVARQDASLFYVYSPFNLSRLPVIVGVGVSGSVSNLHNWEVCLISWQTSHGKYPLVSVFDSRDVQLLDTPLIARYLVFLDPATNYTHVILYWYEKATFKTGITVEQKYVRISLIMLTQNSTEYKALENELFPMAQIIASYWEPLKNMSLISLGVPAQQFLLIASIAFVAATKTTQYSNEWRKKNNNLRIFNNHASDEEKQMLQTILNLAKEKKTMKTNDIKMAIKRKMSTEELLGWLTRLEEYGFIKRDIISVNNEPVQVWKTSLIL